ncbi:hypothetical protein EJ110_NYTH02051 [Nymphaea thermarum]|nr:hypothetical protein EJ110_NYTH02051 [Nymphaea thermarum]
MVLWEITVGTAYFLGLKRTYRLALRIQRRLVRPDHPKLRHFLHRRTRKVFDVALTVHRNIQQRDIEVGKNVGNWILRWLDRMKPSAQIRGDPTPLTSFDTTARKLIKDSKPPTFTHGANNTRIAGQDMDRRIFSSPPNIRLPKSSPTLSMLLRPQKVAGSPSRHYRHIHGHSEPHLHVGRFDGVFRSDIAYWMGQ